MIILVAAVILSLSSNGIIDRANDAVNKTDEKQMQILAQTLWSDAYIDYSSGKITEAELVQRVEDGLFDADKDYKNKYNVEISKTGVALYVADEVWIDMGESREALYVDNKFIFAPITTFLMNSTYRLTVESPLYEGTVVINPWLVESDIIWGFLITDSKKVIEVKSLEEFDEYANRIDEGKLNGEIWIGSTQAIIVISTEEPETTTCKITKSELKLPKESKKIYEGNTQLDYGQEKEVEGLNIERDYVVIGEKTITEGEQLVKTPIIGSVLGASWFGQPSLMLSTSIVDPQIILISDNSIKSLIEESTIEIKEIYDIGKSKYVIRENGFIIATNELGNEDDVMLIGTPDGENVIPKSVGGLEITSMLVDGLRGTIIIDRYIELIRSDWPADLEKVIIKKEAAGILEDYCDMILGACDIDVTDCGDAVVIPEVLLDLNNGYNIKIYVTKNAKQNLYADKTNVIRV